jgi:TonB family protein
MLVSILLAFILHGLVVVVFQYGVRAEQDDEEEYLGPVRVTLYDPSSLQSVAQEPSRERGAEPAAAEEQVEERREPRKREEVAEAPEVQRRVLSESRRRESSETGEPKIREQEPTPRYKRTDPGRRPSEELLQKGGAVESPLEEVPVDIGREQDWVESDESYVLDQEYVEEEHVRESGPAFLSSPEEEQELVFNYEKLDEAFREGDGEAGGVQGGTADDRTGGESRSPRSHGTPNIVWEDSSAGRELLSTIEKPDFPDWVKREGLGDLIVEVSFTVIPEGYPSSLAVNLSSGFPDVDSAVLEVVRKLQFTPISEDHYARGSISFLISTE